MRISRGVRNVSVVILAFALVAVLIVLARYRPPARVLPPESSETATLRFSRTENAWYVLQDALKLVPKRPFVDPRTTVDYQFGPMGQFTGVYLPDDHPEHVAWVRACKPAIERARAALEMDHLLMPVAFPTQGPPWEHMKNLAEAGLLPSVMLATAALEARNGTPQSVLDNYRDGLRLALRLRNSLPGRAIGNLNALCRLLRQFKPEVQREALPWLIEFNFSKPPPLRAVEDKVRLNECWKDAWKQMLWPPDPKQIPRAVGSMARSRPARRTFVANLDAILSAFCMTQCDYETWKNSNPELDDAAENSFPYLYPQSFCYENSNCQISLDVMELVLAIELYRHGHGSYPPSLDALTPEFLPKAPQNTAECAPFYYHPAGPQYWLALKAHSEDPASLTYVDILVSPPE